MDFECELVTWKTGTNIETKLLNTAGKVFTLTDCCITFGLCQLLSLMFVDVKHCEAEQSVVAMYLIIAIVKCCIILLVVLQGL
jgi:hypothetical protein